MMTTESNLRDIKTNGDVEIIQAALKKRQPHRLSHIYEAVLEQFTAGRSMEDLAATIRNAGFAATRAELIRLLQRQLGTPEKREAALRAFAKTGKAPSARKRARKKEAPARTSAPTKQHEEQRPQT